MYRQKKILFIGDSSLLVTGYATVIRNLLKYLEFLHPENSYSHLGWYHPMNVFNSNLLLDGDMYFNYIPVIPTEQDKIGVITLPKVINEYKPDIVVVVNDPWFIDVVPSVISSSTKNFFLINYMAIDSKPMITKYYKSVNNKGIIQDIESSLKTADMIILFTEFAKEVFLECLPDYDKEKIKVIPHGVDPFIYYPLNKEHAIQVIYRHLGIDLSDKYVFGFVSANQPRKNIPQLIHAFSKVVNKWKHQLKENYNKTIQCRKPFLFLYTSDTTFGWNIYELLKEYNVQNFSYVFTSGPLGTGKESSFMNVVYNAFDVLVMPSNREGWGLPALEALATGTPIIVTKWGPLYDWSKDVAIPIDTKYFTRAFGTNYLEAHVDIDDLYAKMFMMYNKYKSNKGYRDDKCIEFAHKFSWDKVADMWAEVFSQIPVKNKTNDTGLTI